MIEYSVVHHVPGRIRLHVPLLKKIDLRRVKSSGEMKIPSAEGIIRVRPNPITGSLIIEYDPSAVDIEDYVRRLVSDEDLVRFVRSCVRD